MAPLDAKTGWTPGPLPVLPVDGSHHGLQTLFPDEQAADEWVRRPNAARTFGGGSALDRMLSGQVADLYVVRQYLDAQTGGGLNASR